MKVAFARHIGPYPDCCRAWEKLCGDPEVQKRIGPDTLILGISYDDPGVTDADKLRYEPWPPMTYSPPARGSVSRPSRAAAPP